MAKVNVQTIFRVQHTPQRQNGVQTYSSREFNKLSVLMLVLTFSLVGPASAEEITGRVVGPNGQGIAQAIVFVQALPPGASPPSAQQLAVMDQINKTFVPAVLPVVVGTEVHFPNHDQIHHHVYSFSRTKSFELPLYKGEEAPPVLFDKVGA